MRIGHGFQFLPFKILQRAQSNNRPSDMQKVIRNLTPMLIKFQKKVDPGPHSQTIRESYNSR